MAIHLLSFPHPPSPLSIKPHSFTFPFSSPHFKLTNSGGASASLCCAAPRRGRKKSTPPGPTSPSPKSKAPKCEDLDLEALNYDDGASRASSSLPSEAQSPAAPRRGRKKSTTPKPTLSSDKLKTPRSENGSIETLPVPESEDLDLEALNYDDAMDGASSSLPSEAQSSAAPRRGRKKSTAPKPTMSSDKLKNPKSENGSTVTLSVPESEDLDLEALNYDDGMDGAPYPDPPLVCCFGAAQKEFLPSVRVSEVQMHPDIYSEWKMMQWKPPEFSRAPGGPPSNVAISHVRLGGRAAFLGKVGDDEFGQELVNTMNKEKVQTRGVKFDSDSKTACSFMRIRFDEDGRMRSEVVKESAEDSLLGSELNLAVLKEARIFHFNSEVLTSPSMHSTLFKAINLSKKFGSLVFFDPNLPLPLWKSRDETREVIKKAWNEANIIEVSRQELEFLLDEDHYERKRNYRPQYYADNYEQSKDRRDYYHYEPEELEPLWHDGIKLLFVTDGTLRIHYYSPTFHGTVVGTEDVLITPFTCDRTGSGDAVVAAIMRKLTVHPEMFEDQDFLERQLRFAIAAGIISQWTIGGVRGFPTESATQNLKEQVYVPSMW